MMNTKTKKPHIKHWKHKQFWNTLESEEDLINYKLVRVYSGKSRCICGTAINTIFLLKSPTGKFVEIGKCCAKKFGLNLKWRSKADYLNSTMLLVKTSWEENFVKGLIDRLGKWGDRLIISQRQKEILEGISKKSWRWKVWEEVRN